MPDNSRARPDVTAADVQATFCATLVDEWMRLGVRHAVVAPGSRSTPMALALADRSEIELHVVHDERSAAFVALGIGSVRESPDHAPALLLCTSGTAAANFSPAVVEAGLSEVPLIVLTADRPDELRGVGAPQTIDQIELFGRHVRWFTDAPVPEEAEASTWRQLAGEAWSRAAWGPVQLNLPFREPLLGRAQPLPPEGSSAVCAPRARPADPVPEDLDQQRGVILVGGLHGVNPEQILEFHEMTQWPLLADPTSRIRGRTAVVTTADSLLRHEGFARDHAPSVVVRVGRPPASKVLNAWAAAEHVLMIQVGGPGVIDPDHNVRAVCTMDDLLAARPRGATGTTWLARWTNAETRADTALGSALAAQTELSEPGTARVVAAWADDRADVTVSSSMPVRDLEWFGGRAASAHANRGANGIDGVISTAVGRALARGGVSPAVVLIGDLAFVHDSNALVALARRAVDLRIVVVDNDGGGIFSFLPQATALSNDRFEQLFGTPSGTDVLALAAAHGLPTSVATTEAELRTELDRQGPRVIRVPSARDHNVEIHQQLHATVADALG